MLSCITLWAILQVYVMLAGVEIFWGFSMHWTSKMALLQVWLLIRDRMLDTFEMLRCMVLSLYILKHPISMYSYRAAKFIMRYKTQGCQAFIDHWKWSYYLSYISSLKVSYGASIDSRWNQLWHWHSIKVHVLTVLLSIQLPANGWGKAVEHVCLLLSQRNKTSNITQYIQKHCAQY